MISQIILTTIFLTVVLNSSQQATFYWSLGLEGHVVCLPHQGSLVMFKKGVRPLSQHFYIINQGRNFMKWKYRDELGRERISWPRTGQLSVYLYASLFHSSTSALHANTILKPIVECENKGAVTIICDGGSDWRTKFTQNLINNGRLWKHLKLDVLNCFDLLCTRAQ